MTKDSPMTPTPPHDNPQKGKEMSDGQSDAYTVTTGQLVILLTTEFQDLQRNDETFLWKPIDYAIEAIRFLGKYKYESSKRESVKQELEEAISNLHYLTVPYEARASQLGAGVWHRLDDTKNLLMKVLSKIENQEAK